MGTERKPLFEHKMIKRQSGGDYLERWAFNTPLFCIKIHKIIASDDFCMHDHPWGYKSLILKGGYIEEYPCNVHYIHDKRTDTEIASNIETHYGDDGEPYRMVLQQIIKPPRIISRARKHIHRLILNKRPDGSEIPCWTFVITGPRIQNWGFYTKKGWIKWNNYIGSRDC